MYLLPVVLFLFLHTIHTAPPTIAELPGGPQKIVEAGSSFTLTCLASGWPAPRIQVNLHKTTCTVTYSSAELGKAPSRP